MQLIIPESEFEIMEIVRSCMTRGGKLRVLGARQSHPPMLAAADAAISMEKMTGVVSIDKRSATVTVRSGTLVDQLCLELWDTGFCLLGLGSVSGQTIGGLVATGSHAQGIHQGSVSSYVLAMRLIDGRGQLLVLKKEDDPDAFNAFPVSFGCLGIVTELTLAIVPRYFIDSTTELFNYRENPDRVMDLVINTASIVRIRPELGLAKATLILTSSTNTGSERLMRSIDSLTLKSSLYDSQFKIGFGRKAWLRAKRWQMRCKMKLLRIPRNDQGMRRTEYAIPLDQAPKVIHLIEQHYRSNYPYLRGFLVIRSAKADDLWLSNCQGATMCYVACHVYCDPHYSQHFDRLEDIMQRHDGRPHWGKEFKDSIQNFEHIYPKWNDFKRLRDEMDPYRLFENEWQEMVMSR